MRHFQSEVTIDTGDAIRVALNGVEAKVMIMDDHNFRRYCDGSRFEFAGGSYGQSPAVIRPLKPGHWNVVIDLGNYTGTINPEVSVIH